MGNKTVLLHCRGSDLITSQTCPDALQDRLPISQPFDSSRDKARELQPPSQTPTPRGWQSGCQYYPELELNMQRNSSL